jgi:hypothetical protein
MAIDVSPIAPPTGPLVPTAASQSASFDARWAAWLAKGAAHDRVVHRKMMLAAPICVVVAAVIMFAFLGR